MHNRPSSPISSRQRLLTFITAASSIGWAVGAPDSVEPLPTAPSAPANTEEQPAQLPPVAGSDEVQSLTKIAGAHPASVPLTRYLRSSLSNNHEEAASVIDPTSLGAFQFRTINAVRTRIDAATGTKAKVDLTQRVLGELGFKSIKEMESAAPKTFYITVQDARDKADIASQRHPADSVEVNILGMGGEDNGRTVHFVTRTIHREEVMTVSAVRMTSLIKAGRDWMVSLQSQQPRLEPLSEKELQEQTPEAPVITEPTSEKPAPDPELERMKKLLEESGN